MVSLDALRGFDMLWIIGAEGIVQALAKWRGTPWLETWAEQLEHVPWEGLRAYDLIFPLFMFLSGVAIPLSLESRLDRGDALLRLAGKILSRTVLLVILGLVYNGILSGQQGPPRFASVLGQIGIAWGIAATLMLLVRGTWQRIALVATILGIVAALQLLVPVPEHGAGILTKTGAINTWIDRGYFPGKLYGRTFDPEGLLCIFSASAVTLAGAVMGMFLKRATSYSWKLAGGIFISGLAVTGAGWLCWHLGYPPIKALWTATFDLWAIGLSLVVFSVFFAVIDVLRFHHWSFPLRVIGMNALTIYLLTRFIDFGPAADLLFGRLASALQPAQEVVIASGVLLLEWLVLFFLYRKKIFLRV